MVNAKVKMNIIIHDHLSFTHIYSIEVTTVGYLPRHWYAVKAEIGQSAGTATCAI